MSYPNGTAVDYTYNGGTGWLSQVAHQKDGAANPFLSLTYTRNGIGLIKGVSESANGAATGSWAYDYDGLKRLTAATWTPSAGSPTLYGYTYDRNGNRRSYDVTGSARRHYVYNELDQLREERLGATLGASTLDKSYTWDKYGRMGSETASGGSPTVARQYKWTVDDRLVSVVLGDNPSNDPVIKYAYDHLGTRVSRSALGETAKHLTDYENPSGYSQTLAEVEGDGLNVLKNYFYGSEYGPLAQRGTGANGLAFLHGDHLQTTRQLTDGEGDVLLASSQKYEPFGTPTPDGLSSLTSYAFTGQSRDLDTGLQYHRARWLNTSQGRWLSTDPVFDFANLANDCAYSLDPLNLLDPLGAYVSSGEALGVSGEVAKLQQIQIVSLSSVLASQAGLIVVPASSIAILSPIGLGAIAFLAILAATVLAALVLYVYAAVSGEPQLAPVRDLPRYKTMEEGEYDLRRDTATQTKEITALIARATNDTDKDNRRRRPRFFATHFTNSKRALGIVSTQRIVKPSNRVGIWLAPVHYLLMKREQIADLLFGPERGQNSTEYFFLLNMTPYVERGQFNPIPKPVIIKGLVTGGQEYIFTGDVIDMNLQDSGGMRVGLLFGKTIE